MSRALSRPEFLLLGFVLVFSPLAFGTVEPWSLAIADGTALLGLAVALRRRTSDGRVFLHATPGALPLLLFLGFLLFQLAPLPPPLVRLLSPSAFARWDAALGAAGPLPWLPLSLDPLATLREFCRFTACGALYLLTVQVLARRERLDAATAALPIFAAVLSFAAILQHLVAPERLLFLRQAPSGGPFGPFVNRNHYANLMAMLTPVLLGLFLGRPAGGGGRGLRERLVALLAGREPAIRLLLGFAALLAAASLVVSLSRGATVAAIAALLVLGSLMFAHRRARRAATAAALFFAAFTVFVGWFGWDKVAANFSSLRTNPDVVDATRAGIWRDCLRMAADFPLLGSGIGSFASLYPAYRTVPGPFAVAHAHNDHLELIAGGGAIGIGLFGWFVGAVLFAAVRDSREQKDRRARVLAFGSIAGCGAFLVHAASDFSLAIGANALYFFFLLGLAVAAARAPDPRRGEATAPGGRRLPAIATRAGMALAFIVPLLHGADVAASLLWSRAGRELRRDEALRPPLGPILERAALVQPLDHRFPATLARLALQRGETGDAMALTRRALHRLPVDAGSLMLQGTLLAALGRADPARRSFEAALAADPAAAGNLERYGAWLLSRGDRDAGAAKLRAALTLDPERTPQIIGMLVLAGFGDERIAALLPPSPAVLLKFARYSATTGAPALAEKTYTRVLAIDPANPEAKRGLATLAKRR